MMRRPVAAPSSHSPSDSGLFCSKDSSGLVVGLVLDLELGSRQSRTSELRPAAWRDSERRGPLSPRSELESEDDHPRSSTTTETRHRSSLVIDPGRALHGSCCLAGPSPQRRTSRASGLFCFKDSSGLVV